MLGYALAVGTMALVIIALTAVIIMQNKNYSKEKSELLNRIMSKGDVSKYIELKEAEDAKKKEVTKMISNHKELKANTPKIATLSPEQAKAAIESVYMGE